MLGRIMVICQYCGGDLPLGHEKTCQENPAIKEIEDIRVRLRKLKDNTESSRQQYELDNLINRLDGETRETMTSKDRDIMEHVDMILEYTKNYMQLSKGSV